MKVYYRNHIELIRAEQIKKEKLITSEMLDISKKERKIWISGQNLSKL